MDADLVTERHDPATRGASAGDIEDLRARLKDPSILDERPGNPVPASFEIQLPRGADPQGIVADLSTEPALDPQLGIERA